MAFFQPQLVEVPEAHTAGTSAVLVLIHTVTLRWPKGSDPCHCCSTLPLKPRQAAACLGALDLGLGGSQPGEQSELPWLVGQGANTSLSVKLHSGWTRDLPWGCPPAPALTEQEGSRGLPLGECWLAGREWFRPQWLVTSSGPSRLPSRQDHTQRERRRGAPGRAATCARFLFTTLRKVSVFFFLSPILSVIRQFPPKIQISE